MILDSQAALERIEHDRELYAEICGIFRDDAPQIFEQLKMAFGSGDIAAATRNAHSLKSSAANIGATDLSETARLAESTLRAGEFESIHALISRLDSDIAHVLKALG